MGDHDTLQPSAQWLSECTVGELNTSASQMSVFPLYRVSQELRSLLRDLIPELTLNKKSHVHMGPIHNVQEL